MTWRIRRDRRRLARSLLIEPDVAERWEMPDDTTYVFHPRHGVRWQ